VNGKCIYCEHHVLIGRKKFACRNPAKGIRLKEQHIYAAPASKARQLPHAGETSGLEETYPEVFTPASLVGECENWRLKSYEEEKG
jgi:hypothetical protein